MKRGLTEKRPAKQQIAKDLLLKILAGTAGGTADRSRQALDPVAVYPLESRPALVEMRLDTVTIHEWDQQLKAAGFMLLDAGSPRITQAA
jgi:hypothetical protein